MIDNRTLLGSFVMSGRNYCNATIDYEHFLFAREYFSPYQYYEVFGPLIHINIVCILVFSILWAFFLIRTLWKDYRKEKIYLKLRNTVPEYQWFNTMNNFRSNKIKNCLLLAICLSESGITVMLVYIQLMNFLSIMGRNIVDKFRFFISNTATAAPYGELEFSTSNRLYSVSILTTSCLLAFLIRILTQYMVYQYSYFKPRLSLKFEIYISLSCLFFLFFMATFLRLLKIFSVCIVFLLCYEYILLVIASRKLCLLLKQRLSDAIIHEYQSNYVILYYRIGYKDYKICSTVMLIALFAQYLGISIYCFYMLISAVNPYSYLCLDEFFLRNIFISSSFINVIGLILLILGTSIQILVYMMVSFRRLFRYIRSRININESISSQRSSIQSMIEKNYMAYRVKNEFRNISLYT